VTLLANRWFVILNIVPPRRGNWNISLSRKARESDEHARPEEKKRRRQLSRRIPAWESASLFWGWLNGFWKVIAQARSPRAFESALETFKDGSRASPKWRNYVGILLHGMSRKIVEGVNSASKRKKKEKKEKRKGTQFRDRESESCPLQKSMLVVVLVDLFQKLVREDWDDWEILRESERERERERLLKRSRDPIERVERDSHVASRTLVRSELYFRIFTRSRAFCRIEAVTRVAAIRAARNRGMRARTQR